MNREQEQGHLFLWQRFLNVEVFRKNKDLLGVELYFQEASREDRLRVELFIKDFTIKNAILERPRSYGATISPLSLSFLQGRSIYFKEGRNLKKAMLEWGETESFPSAAGGATPYGDVGRLEGFTPTPADREHFADLFLELIANVIQVEVYILEERGIFSLQEYDRFFNEMYGDMCVLYSELRGRVPEYAYTQGQQRSDSLFSRHRSIFVFKELGTGDRHTNFSIHANLCDSFHEMALYLSVSPASTPPYHIERAGGNFLRFPDPTCAKGTARLQELTGVHLLPENKKAILSALTGPRGCSHMGDLAVEAARTLQELERSKGCGGVKS